MSAPPMISVPRQKIFRDNMYHQEGSSSSKSTLASNMIFIFDKVQKNRGNALPIAAINIHNAAVADTSLNLPKTAMRTM